MIYCEQILNMFPTTYLLHRHRKDWHVFSLKHPAHRWENSPQNINTGKATVVRGANPFVGRKLTLDKHRELDLGLFEKGPECSPLQRLGQKGSYVQGITPDSEWGGRSSAWYQDWDLNVALAHGQQDCRLGMSFGTGSPQCKIPEMLI